MTFGLSPDLNIFFKKSVQVKSVWIAAVISLMRLHCH